MRRIAIDLAFLSEGINMESKRAMIAMTTSSSTRVNPDVVIFTIELGQGRFVLVVSGLIIKRNSLLDCNAFCKVSRFVNVVSAEHGSVIGQKLQRHDGQHRLQKFRSIRDCN